MAADEPQARPQKPNEETFKVDLAQAEKEHAAVQEKLVRSHVESNCEEEGRHLTIAERSQSQD